MRGACDCHAHVCGPQSRYPYAAGEDFPAGRTIQIGLTSGAQTHTVFGRNEPAMIHYHRSMREALGLPMSEQPLVAAE